MDSTQRVKSFKKFLARKDGSLVESLDTLGSIPLIDAVIPEALAERAAAIYRLVSQKTEVSKKLLSPNSYVKQSPHTDGVTHLYGHKSEVFSCSWHPSSKSVATGSADGIVALWQLDAENIKMVELNHRSDSKSLDEQSADITSISWHPVGDFIATASALDHHIRIWNKEGNLVTTLTAHTDLILSLSWSKNGALLLSAGLDKKCIIWKFENWQILQEYHHHTGPVVDTDWQSANVFASCSTDKTICICKIESKEPMKVLLGHSEVVNCIAWDPTGNVLASCADDKLIKLWNLKQNKSLCDLSGHTKEVTQIKWNSKRLLASASYDTSVRIWDVENSVCLHTFAQHLEPVNSLSFDFNGSYIVSASLDGFVNIWNVQSGACILSRRNVAGVFEALWSPNGSYICVCMANKVVKILDVRKILEN